MGERWGLRGCWCRHLGGGQRGGGHEGVAGWNWLVGWVWPNMHMVGEGGSWPWPHWPQSGSFYVCRAQIGLMEEWEQGSEGEAVVVMGFKSHDEHAGEWLLEKVGLDMLQPGQIICNCTAAWANKPGRELFNRSGVALGDMDGKTPTQPAKTFSPAGELGSARTARQSQYILIFRKHKMKHIQQTKMSEQPGDVSQVSC